MTWLLRPYSETSTYRRLLYLLLGLPLGVIEFTLVVTGLSLGLGLMILIIGIPLMVLVLMMIRGLAAMECGLARSLLDSAMPRMEDPRDAARGILWGRLRVYLTSGRTWQEVCFLVLRLPVGVLDFTVAVTIIALMLGGPAQSIIVAAGGSTILGSWTIDTFVESLVFWPLSALFILVGPRLMLAWSNLSSKLATSLLGKVSQSEIKSAIVETLSRAGEADGFEILDELTLRLGRGPFLDSTRVEAALLSLESNGFVASTLTDNRAVYSLTV